MPSPFFAGVYFVGILPNNYKSPVIKNPIDGSPLPYIRQDSAGNKYLYWKEEGKYKKKNIGRKKDWYIKYLKLKAEALQVYWKETDNQSKYVFVSNAKTKYAPNTISKKMRELLDKVKLNHICHKHFRDSFETVSVLKKVYNPSINAVMGHVLKDDQGNRYLDISKNPLIAEEACKAVHDYYFG